MEENKKKIEKYFECPLTTAMGVIGGKWKVVILGHLYDSEKRFGELKKLICGDITQKMLTQQLRELEEDGLIARTIFAEVPPRVEYTITPSGETVFPILETLAKWGMAQREKKG